MGNEETIPFAQKIISTVVASLIVAAVLGSFGAWNLASKDSVRLDNLYIAVGEISGNQKESLKALRQTVTTLATIELRVNNTELECKEVKADMKEHAKAKQK